MKFKRPFKEADAFIAQNLNKKFKNFSKKNFKNDKLKKLKFSSNLKNCNADLNQFGNRSVNKVNDKPNTRKMEIKLNGNHINEEKIKLPIAGVRNKIIDVVKKSECLIFIGETACGKTTQIPQYLFQANFVIKNKSDCQIGITQPRRVAAMSIANRVSAEMNCQLGTVVGYTVRFDDKTNPMTKIKYLTDGILLREAINDPLLSKYKIIILDEAHERSLQTDVLFGVVKKAQQIRREKQMPILKVIIMSATMDVDHFSSYFNNAPVYYLPGRQFSIKMMYTTKKQSDYIHSALVTVFQIHQNEPEGDILVFCTGQEEIEYMVSMVKDVLPQLAFDHQKLKPLPLYAALPYHVQLNVFKTISGFRKVIFATNIAETSITISNIKYVVDTGMVKQKNLNSSTGMETLKSCRISKAQACQRAGRAGRESSGTCYRLYTKEEYNSFKNYNIPDIQCCNLSNVILQLIAIGINDVTLFDFMSKPPIQNINNALDELDKLGAIEIRNEMQYLTSQGKQMIQFPVEPRFSKMIVTSSTFNCTEEIIIIISLLSVDSIFYIPSNQKEIALEVHKKFTSSEGDLIKLLNVFKGYKEANQNFEWCKENFIHIHNMKIALEIRKQLLEICSKANIAKSSCGKNTEFIRRCLNSGLFLNTAVLQKDGNYKTMSTKQEVFIHPTSCLFGSKPECVVFTELIQTTKSYMRNVTVIPHDWFK